MKNEIVRLEDAHFGLWDAFCETSDDAWFWHTTQWLTYSLCYGRDRLQTRDLSFFIRDEKGIAVICPLFLENNPLPRAGCALEFQAGGGPVIAPAFRNDLGDDHREKLFKEVFRHIDFLAGNHGVARHSLYLSPLARSQTKFFWLMKMGFFDNSLHSQVIDLSPGIDVLWKNVRKGHKSDIKRGQSFYQVAVHDRDSITREIFEQYRLLHHKAAGRVTRPLETFEMMYQWVRKGNGLLVSASWDGRFAGFSYIGLFKGSAYYISASEDPELGTNVPVYHATQWTAIQWLKENGFACYEIGTQQFGPQMYDVPGPKDLNISHFKRGFGGATVPLLRAEKFYDVGYMDFLFHKRLDMLKASIKFSKDL